PISVGNLSEMASSTADVPIIRPEKTKLLAEFSGFSINRSSMPSLLVQTIPHGWRSSTSYTPIVAAACALLVQSQRTPSSTLLRVHGVTVNEHGDLKMIT